MFLSIVIPVYNVENYIEQCIQSILKQTFTDFELILVNDGSTDRSGEICDYYTQKDHRIKVLHILNQGQSYARNLGFQESKGKYILFIDSDDFIIDNEFFNIIYTQSFSKPDLILYKFQKFYDETKILEDCHFNLPDISLFKTKSEIIKQLVKSDAFYCSPWTKCIKRNLLSENNIVFSGGMSAEDQDWYYNVILVAKRIEVINKSFIAYRQRQGSVTKNYSIQNLKDCLNVIYKWIKNFETIDIDNDLKYALTASLSKYYCNMIILYSRIDGKLKKDYKSEILRLDYLFNYDENKRTMIFSRLYKVFGFSGLIFILTVINKLKRR